MQRIEHRRTSWQTVGHQRVYRRLAILLGSLLLFPLISLGNPTLRREAKPLINFDDREALARRRPIVVAHRGGIVSETSPECSVTAIQLAATDGYDLVELDIQRSQDQFPIVFHDRTLNKACGRDGRIEDFTAEELEAIAYVGSTDKIIRLDTALQWCRRLNLGVMLDLKTGRDARTFLRSIDELVVRHGLEKATISISGSEAARRHLNHVRFTPTNDEMRRLRNGEAMDLRQRFWFGLPRDLAATDVRRLKTAGALILPAINTFRYAPEKHFEHAERDIQQLLQWGVDGFQIDSIYRPIIRNRK